MSDYDTQSAAEAAERDLPEAVYARLRDGGFFDTPPADQARLAMSDAAAELADRARGQVDTTSDGYAVGGEFVEAAQRILSEATDLLGLAVIYERARRTSWADIGEALGVSRQAAQERFAPAVRRWEEGLDMPYTPTPRAHLPNLPPAAMEPRWAAGRLDRWVVTHRQPGDVGAGEAPVSGGLGRDRAVRLHTAVIAMSARLMEALRRRVGGFHPVHERVQAERRVAMCTAALADPLAGDAEGYRAELAEVRGRIEEIRGRGDRSGARLHAVPDVDMPYDDEEA